MFVLGTAGHIDHGKSELVKALTGIDPDRLREEKERGMTLDLGFAWLRLPSGREVGIVDVPGHERFVRNMLAGVGGIDLALLVIAANEGVMPQTREHLAIIDLLEIKRGIVALTKKDLVDDEWLTLVRMEVEDLLKPTTLNGSPIIPVSSVSREGLPELISTIDNMLASSQPKKDIGRPRLPIDRVFTIAGSGTIVTGTLIDGSLSTGQNVEIVPAGLKSRIRGLQTHKAHVDNAAPGSRVAANLVGITTEQLRRGDVLTAPGWLTPTSLVTARLRLLAQPARVLKHGTMVGFHTGADETMSKVRILDGNEVKPGESAWVQFSLEAPVAAVSGDHFIIRSTTETLGGGKIIEAHAARLRRFRPETIQSLDARSKGGGDEAVLASLQAKQPAELAGLASQTGLPEAELRAAVERLAGDGMVVRLGEQEPHLLFTRSGWEQVSGKAVGIVEDYHRRFPARTGMPKVELISKLGAKAHAPAILHWLTREGKLQEEGLVVRLTSHQVRLSAAQQAKVDAFLKSLAASPYAPPSEMLPEPELLNVLIERGQAVKVSEGVVFSAAAYDEMVKKVIETTRAKGKITLAEVRDMFGTSRKYAQALLEHLDEKKVTRRVGDERVLWREG